MSKLYLIIGTGILAAYMYTESRGKVFTSTDTKAKIAAGAKGPGSSSNRRSRSFWFVGGYRGGK